MGGLAKKTGEFLLSLLKEDKCLTEKARIRRRRFIKITAFCLPVIFFSLVLFLSFPETAEAGRIRNWLRNKATDGISEFLIDFVAAFCYAILALCALVLYLTGVFFEWVVGYTILDLGQNLGGVMGEGFRNAWGILRDLANMLFIFVLLYIAITTILQMGGGNTKRLLKNVVIVALLINFSMFFTHVIIDFTNAFAIAFHGAAAGRVQAVSEGRAPEHSVTDTFMNNAYLPSPFSGGGFGEGWGDLRETYTDNWSSLFGITFIGSAFYLIMAFVLFAGAILLISRFVMFIILIILSPLAFISNILPNTSGMFQRWFQSLTNNALFAPIFMALIWAALVVIPNLNDVPTDVPGGQTALVGMADHDLGTDGPIDPPDRDEVGLILFSILISAGFLVASLIIAKSLSIQGGAHMAGLGKRWGGAVFGGATVGLAARGGRRVVGGTASRIADSKRVKQMQASDSKFLKALGNKVQQGADYTAKSSFDVRSTGAVGSTLGSAKTGGYKAQKDKKDKQAVDRMNRLSPSAAEIHKAKRDLEFIDSDYKQRLNKAEAAGDTSLVEAIKEQRRDAQKELDELQGVSKEVAAERKAEYEERVKRNQGYTNEDLKDPKNKKKFDQLVKEEAKQEGKYIQPIGSGEARKRKYIKGTTEGKLRTDHNLRAKLIKELERDPQSRQLDTILEEIKKQDAQKTT